MTDGSSSLGWHDVFRSHREAWTGIRGHIGVVIFAPRRHSHLPQHYDFG